MLPIGETKEYAVKRKNNKNTWKGNVNKKYRTIPSTKNQKLIYKLID